MEQLQKFSEYKKLTTFFLPVYFPISLGWKHAGKKQVLELEPVIIFCNKTDKCTCMEEKTCVCSTVYFQV